MKNKILFIDWHETISKDKFFSSLHNSEKVELRKLARAIENFLFNKHKDYATRWMIGEFKSEDIIGFISEEFNLNYTWIWDLFVNDCKNLSIPEYFYNRIFDLKKYYIVVLITGNMDCFNRYTIPYQKLNDLFDLIINSSDLGYFKSDFGGKAFKDIIYNQSTSAFHCYLMDDDKKVCEVFRKLGGTPINLNIKKSKLICKKLDKLLIDGPNMLLPLVMVSN